MELKLLKSFVSVATHRSFSKAAKELHTVQPAISRHITSLEDELDTSLFFRTSREVIITAAGERLLQDAVKIIEQTEKTKQAVIRAAKGTVGSLKIGYLGGATLSFLPRLVRQYISEYPHIDVDLIEMTASEQMNALSKREIDIGFSRPLPNDVSDNYISTTIYVDKLVAVVPVTHIFANLSAVELTQLADEPFILFEREQAVGLFDTIIAQCGLAGFSPQIKKQPQNMQSVLTQVSSGLGISIAPYAIRDLRSEGCSFLDLESIDVRIPLVMTHHMHSQSPTTNAFSQLVKSELADIALAMK
ncbi:LysR family transcriptional regulator [Vibrio vulnificus]|nr:LysR family transcriptional regulator [Vibrio vulnificus]